MKRYRVMESHCGDPPEYYGTYEFNSDKEAREWFAKEKEKPSNGYSTLSMKRIDVEEKTTSIS